ncbi:RNA polymerase II-associated protein 1 [Grifola frondosa]|uniref:RNA polymerase II-associated protein 1 n=1 Tax=Grifola frondosa TaxID=5627 RepID=A0A1C7LS85_GRIFR|nr:RNA polymerase II-associated protein 1 [Grifola frondosa]
MSFKKSKLDLLVRVRYSNPLPAPPCPPKLLDIPTDPMRYTRPEFLDDIASEVPLPMVVDAELGMPLDLSRWDCLWEENGDDFELNPDQDRLPKLDPKDQFLLEDPFSASSSFTNHGFGGSTPGTSTPLSSIPHVPWLRKTEYLSREGISRSSLSQDIKHNKDTAIDISRPAQIRDIEASFATTDNFDLATLKHPNKSGVTAVDSYELFPDAKIWANAYDLFRFSERPGERPPDVEDPRLDCAILRPMESDGDHFLAYYLTKEDDAAIEFKSNRLARSPDAPEEDEPTPFHFVRDYETVKVEQEVPNEFLLVLEDSDVKEDEEDEFGDHNPKKRRAKGAYYKNIERKMLLKKKRVNSYEAYHDKWDVVKITHIPMTKEEEDEREEALAEVMDPMYLLSRGDVDAEGEVDDGLAGVNGGELNGVHEGRNMDAVDIFGEA